MVRASGPSVPSITAGMLIPEKSKSGNAAVMRMVRSVRTAAGIQPSIIKDIGRAIRFLRDTMGMTILLVEQYLDFARELADKVAIMDRGEVVYTGGAEGLDDPDVRRHLTI